MKKLYLVAGVWMSLIFSSSCVGLAQEKSVGISGLIEVEFEKKEKEKSNLFIGDVEVSFDVKLNDKVCGNVLLRPDTPKEILDEATIELEKFHPLPISITVGKTIMPFGVFESHLISDPLTKEKWETNQVGVIVGYKGNIVKVNGAIYDSSNNEDVGAFAFQLLANPKENFVIGASYKNYPEDVGTETYTTHGDVSTMFSYTKGKMILDAEYCKATKREGGEAKPSVYFVGCAYQINDILELALRYEKFDDDDETTTSTTSKVSYGLNYSIVEETTLSFEYTKNSLEQGKKEDEFYAKLAMEF